MIRSKLTFATVLVLAVYQPAFCAERLQWNFNSDWKLAVGDVVGADAATFNDAAWKAVTLPHAWNEDSAFRVPIENLPTGIAWYRKRFTLPANSSGKKVILEFQGIRHGGEFYLNGELIGRHENGIMAFGLDISDKVKPGENVLAAKIDNAWDYREKATNQRYQWNDRNFYANYGGINKNVVLHISDRLYQTLPLFSNLGTTGVYIHAREFDIRGKRATVTAESQVKNEYPTARTFDYEVSVADRTGKVVKTFAGLRSTLAAGEVKTISASSRLEGLEFWSWGYGALYDVSTTLKVDGQVVDKVTTRTGFRKAQFQNGALKLNDRTLQIHGYAPRTTNEWPALGTNIPAWMSDFSNQLVVESNGNLVRWMHVTPSKQDVESCDRVGLMQAMPAGDSERDTTGRRWEQRVEVMRDAIIYNRNNPSILFYESGNNAISEEHMAQMKALRDQYDPYGGRAIGSRDMMGSKVAEYGGEMLYINKSATKPMWATEYSRDEGLRLYWDEWSPPFHKEGAGPLYKNEPAPRYNHNQDAHAIENVHTWYDYWRERPGTGRRVNAGGVNIIFADSNTHKRGEAVYRASGEVDAMRLPKDGFFAHQVMWDGWVDVERPRAHILGHWNYAPGTRKPVYVVSSANKVELFLNGKSLGFGQQSDHFLFTFPDVAWQSGTLRAVGTDSSGKTVCEANKITAGAPVSLRLTPRTSPSGWKADGADIALVDVEVVDAQGRRCPTALNPVTFALNGPAQWRGGLAHGPDSYILAQTLPVENGVNRVMLRSLTQAGKVTLTASAGGLKSATLDLTSKVVLTSDNALPGIDLPPFLGRGPTPLGDSLVPTRTPLTITKVAAGVDTDKATATFDDNEDTSWSNDGQLQTGWIRFELEKPATMSDITLKMGGWRSKSYPVRLLIDGKKVFEGMTPTSLGYVTLSFPPTQGRHLQVQLVGNATEGEAAKGVTELNEAQNAATTGDTQAKGTISIVEAELYGPLGKENNMKTPQLTATVAIATTLVAATTGRADEKAAETKKAAEAKPAGVPVEMTVAFRTMKDGQNRYVSSAAKGGLNAKDTKITGRQIFKLIDLNGGDLDNDDKVQIQWAPNGAKPTFWRESAGAISRIGGKSKEEHVFQIKLQTKVTGNEPQPILLQTASGKWVIVTAKGASLATTQTQGDASTLEIAQNPTPESTP